MQLQDLFEIQYLIQGRFNMKNEAPERPAMLLMNIIEYI